VNALDLLAGVACLALPGIACAQAAQPLLHASTSFDVVVRAPYEKTWPLFGREGERAWAGKHWNPEFVHPQPAADVEGAVFNIAFGAHQAVWVTSRFDVETRQFQYVYFIPGLLVTVIDVRFQPDRDNTTHVNVVYTRTALSPEGNEHVAKLHENDQASGKQWQGEIDEYLASKAGSAKP
jgi:hypothetical protein